jgi:hypothetical protein
MVRELLWEIIIMPFKLILKYTWRAIVFPFAFIAIVGLGQLLPFTLGKIHRDGLLMPIKYLSFNWAFSQSVIYMVLYVLTFAKVQWFADMGTAYDQAGNKAINGNQDNTVSGRLGYKIVKNKATWNEKLFDKLLSEYDPSTWNHGIDSIENDEHNVI